MKQGGEKLPKILNKFLGFLFAPVFHQREFRNFADIPASERAYFRSCGYYQVKRIYTLFSDWRLSSRHSRQIRIKIITLKPYFGTWIFHCFICSSRRRRGKEEPQHRNRKTVNLSASFINLRGTYFICPDPCIFEGQKHQPRTKSLFLYEFTSSCGLAAFSSLFLRKSTHLRKSLRPRNSFQVRPPGKLIRFLEVLG